MPSFSAGADRADCLQGMAGGLLLQRWVYDRKEVGKAYPADQGDLWIDEMRRSGRPPLVFLKNMRIVVPADDKA